MRQDSFEFAEEPEIVLILSVQDDLQIFARSDTSEAPFLAAAVAEATPQDADLVQVLAWCHGQWPEVNPGLPFFPLFQTTARYFGNERLSFVGGRG